MPPPPADPHLGRRREIYIPRHRPHCLVFRATHRQEQNGKQNDSLRKSRSQIQISPGHRFGFHGLILPREFFSSPRAGKRRPDHSLWHCAPTTSANNLAQRTFHCKAGETTGWRNEPVRSPTPHRPRRGSCEIACPLTIPSVFVRACPCPSMLVRVRPPHALIEPAKEPTSQDLRRKELVRFPTPHRPRRPGARPQENACQTDGKALR